MFHIIFLDKSRWAIASKKCGVQEPGYSARTEFTFPTMVVIPSASNAPSTVLPRLGLGMAALGRPGYINLDRTAVFGSKHRTVDKMKEQANQVMGKLMSLCATQESSSTTEDSSKIMIPWFDCARSYGLSEQFVGDFLREHRVDPSNVYVSSKWGYTYVADWNVELPEGQKHEVKDHSTENFLKQLEETKGLIGDYVKLYQIHSATFDSGILTDRKAHQALADCRARYGWKIGLSVSGPEQDEILRTAMAITVGSENERLFDSVQCTYNVLEQRPAPALLEAHQAGMDIIIKEGMANGRVFQNDAVQDCAFKHDLRIDQLALACILSRDFQPRVLSGAVTPEQLESNWKALELSKTLDKSIFDELLSQSVVDSEHYWAERSALQWN